ncbi:MAG: hypothetical protein AAGA53_03760 [Pseudomonadota bacterium]
MRACLLTVSLALLVWGIYHTLGIGAAFAVLTIAVGLIISVQEQDTITIVHLISGLSFPRKKSY